LQLAIRANRTHQASALGTTAILVKSQPGAQ